MSDILTKFSVNEVKKKCPYMEKCYRRNPIHFNEMSHPHLEKLIVDQLQGLITLPDDLGFECSDRNQLLEQLQVLQMVMRKEREKNGTLPSDISNTKSSKPPQNKAPDLPNLSNETTLNDLKQSIEKHRKASALRREMKLKDMDAKAAEAMKASSSRIPACDLRSELVALKNELTNDRKRAASPQPDSPIKKARSAGGSSNFNDTNSDISASSSSSSSSSKKSSSSSKKSVMSEYSACKSQKSREAIRDKTISIMNQQGIKVKLVQPGEFALKHALSAPYHLFYTRVESATATYNQKFTITFPEILDKSLGEIVNSLHINFMVELGWLCLQYLLAAQNAQMTIMCGEICDSEEKVPLNITPIIVNMPTPFGCHHSKLSILKYSNDGIRVIVSSANLYSDDWENRTQGLWISPHLPPLPESMSSNDGESRTGFKKDLEQYLLKYKHPALMEWAHLVRRADFSEVNVFFVGSVPGSHKGLDQNLFGHQKVAQIFSKHVSLPPDAPQWPIIAQSSSIGSFGANFDAWLQKDFVSSMSREHQKGLKSQPNFQFIYPSLKNYEASFDCKAGSCCLPYSAKVHSKQEWLKAYMYQWKASKIGRDQAMPHIKSYTRVSPNLSEIPWFILTSANLSKAAWGSTTKSSHYIMNYEAGVIFIPKFVINKPTIPIKESKSTDVPVFPMPYDLPLTKYGDRDVPFVIDVMNS